MMFLLRLMQKLLVFTALNRLLNFNFSLARRDAKHYTTVFMVQLQVNKYNTNCNTANSNGSLRLIYKDSLDI
jgi:hypothetical protein